MSYATLFWKTFCRAQASMLTIFFSFRISFHCFLFALWLVGNLKSSSLFVTLLCPWTGLRILSLLIFSRNLCILSRFSFVALPEICRGFWICVLLLFSSFGNLCKFFWRVSSPLPPLALGRACFPMRLLPQQCQRSLNISSFLSACFRLFLLLWLNHWS